MPPKQDPSTETIDRARVYKSRNKRPCDFCRYKKAACHLEVAPPCELCVRYGKECTFVESPAKRRRPNEEQRQQQQQQSTLRDAKLDMSTFPGHCSISSLDTTMLDHHNRHGRIDSMDLCPQLLPSPPQVDFLSWEAGLPSFAMDSALADVDFPFDPQLFTEPKPFDDLELIPASAASVATFEEPQFAADSLRGSENSAASIKTQFAGLRPALQFETIGELLQERPWKKALDDMIPPTEGARLARLYFQHVQPPLPVLPLTSSSSTFVSQGSSFPTHVLAAVYAHALPFATCEADIKSSVPGIASASGLDTQDTLHTLSHAALQSAIASSPDLSTIQTLLLHLHRRNPAQSTGAQNRDESHSQDDGSAAKWAMMCQAVGLVQALGLDQSCTYGKTLSTEERRLRKRLAWGVWVTEKWLAAGLGRRSLIGKAWEDWEVKPLSAEDFMAADAVTENDSEETICRQVSLSLSPTPTFPQTNHGRRKRKLEEMEDHEEALYSEHFVQLCGLTEIVDNILTHLYSSEAMRELGESLDKTLEIAKPLRLRLSEWLRSLPAGVLVIDASPRNGSVSSGVTSNTTTSSNSPQSETPSDRSNASTTTRTVESSPPSSTFSSPRPISPTAEIHDLPPSTSKSDLFFARSSSPHSSPNHHAHSPHVSATPLHLSYITAKILLFRALLRASPTSPSPEFESKVDAAPSCPALLALRTGALCTAREILSFIAHLTPEDMRGFWPGYSIQQIEIASKFMLELGGAAAMTVDGDGVTVVNEEERRLVLEWRDVLREKEELMQHVVGSGLRIVEEGIERWCSGKLETEAETAGCEWDHSG